MNFNHTYQIIAGFALIICFSLTTDAQNVTLPPNGNNQRSIASQYIGSLVTVTINYSSPDVHAPDGTDRTGKIWGQLVPYGLTNLGFGTSTAAPWRAGANENTTIEFSHDVNVQGEKIKAGKYGLHLIVEESGPWTVIFSKNSSAWGSFFYNESDDALRVKASPKESEFNEWLTYEFIDRQANSATVAMKWENKMLPFNIEVPNINQLYVQNFRNELQSTAGFNWRGWVTAVNFCVNNDINLEEALTWSESAIAAPFIGQKNFTTLSAKASVLNKLNRNDEANAIMDEAIKHRSATPQQIHQYGRQLITQGNKEKALEVFRYNHKSNNGAWPTNYGLARGYSSLGNYKSALKYLKIAKTNVPQNDTINPPLIEANIKKLEKGEDIN